MAPVEPHGEKLRRLRRSLGLTQVELALAAGVSERIIRKAEQGQALKRDFLAFIAEALGAQVHELMVDGHGAFAGGLWRRNCDIVAQVWALVHQRGDLERLREFCGPDLRIVSRLTVRTEEAAGLSGDFKGVEGAKLLIRRLYEYAEALSRFDLHTDEVFGTGNLVVSRGTVDMEYRTGDFSKLWWVHLHELQEGLIVRSEWFSSPVDGSSCAVDKRIKGRAHKGGLAERWAPAL